MRLQERFGITSMVVTHDMKSAFQVANHIAYLHEGRIYFHGTPAELQPHRIRSCRIFCSGVRRPNRKCETSAQTRG